MPIKSKKKGNAYEVKIMGEVREFFPDVKTSRSESKILDDKKIDLAFTDPFTIQCKATKTSPPYALILRDMKKAYPDKTPLLFHKRNYEKETVTLFKDDLYKIFRTLPIFTKGKTSHKLPILDQRGGVIKTLHYPFR